MSRFFQSIMGSVTFEVLGGRGERFFNECAAQGIPVQHIVPNPLGFQAQVPLRYYPRLHKLARKQRCRLCVKKKEGAYFAARVYRKRFGIVAGVILAALLLTVFPHMIWTVQFYDFTPQEQIVLRKQLYDYGVCEGSVLPVKKLKEIEQTLFIENTAYSWVKLNYVNGKLVVEKVDAALRPEMEDTSPASIVAKCDGIIERVEVDGGYIERKEGQSVAEGDVIISAVHVGRTGKLHTQRANARVYAEIERTYETVQPLAVTVRMSDTKSTSDYAVFAFNHLFEWPFAREKASQQSSETTILRTPIQFFGLPLPATLVRTQHRSIEPKVIPVSEAFAADLARDRIYDALTADFLEVEVRESTESITVRDDAIVMRIKIRARADIAKVVEDWNA